VKIEHLKVYGAASELKILTDYLDKRIAFHKAVLKLKGEGEEITQEDAMHLRVCIELYDIKEFAYNRLLELTKDLNLEIDEQDTEL
jgi:hypothetical protein